MRPNDFEADLFTDSPSPASSGRGGRGVRDPLLPTPLPTLKAGQSLHHANLAVVSCTPGLTKADKPFLRIVLSDGTTKVNAVWWDMALTRPPLILCLDARVDEYQGQPQLNIQYADVYGADDLDDADRQAFGLPPGAQGIFEAFHRAVLNIADDYRIVFFQVIDPQYFLAHEDHAFFTAPAAKGHHHAFAGGLAYHTTCMLRVADALQAGDLYRGAIDWDLVKLAILLHDVGKIDCYEPAGAGYQVTETNNLVGHINLIDAKVCQAHAELESDLDLPHLRHCLLAHHGRLDWGSPVEPSTPEAWLVHLIDMIDSKLAPLL